MRVRGSRESGSHRGRSSPSRDRRAEGPERQTATRTGLAYRPATRSSFTFKAMAITSKF